MQHDDGTSGDHEAVDDEGEIDREFEPVLLRRLRRLGRALLWAAAVLIVTLSALAFYELETSRFQSDYFSSLADEMTFSVADGESDAIRFPTTGPYDERLGYTRIPQFTDRLTQRDWNITAQARWSSQMLDLVDRGYGALYDEKDQAGLRIIDAGGSPVFENEVPASVYTSLADVPRVTVDTLLFVENRTLLDADPPTRNPAIEWKRLVLSLFENALQAFGVDRGRPPGASTLATQLVKLRHSPDGRTRDWRDKFRQMYTASLRAYRHGPDTLDVRREIALHYINSLPLSAVPHTGEIFGLRDGLDVWFDADPDEVDRLLATLEDGTCEEHELDDRGLAFRRVLMLILGQRRPSAFFLRERAELDDLTDSYLRVMRAEGVIPDELAQPALDARDNAVPLGEPPDDTAFNEIKMTTAVRTGLKDVLDAPSLHVLDRLDLRAQSTIEFDVQRAIHDHLMSLYDPETLRSEELVQRSLLPGGTAEDLVFSFTLYERTPLGNALRVQVDTSPQALNVNEGVKLDLGSTAKLRTLATYLALVADLHEELSALSGEERSTLDVESRDVLTQWVLSELKRQPDIALPELLDRAMQRQYSGSSSEVFFTGGGAHRFENFDSKQDRRRFSVREAFQRSVNLVFVRLMRDIVRYYVPRLDNAGPTIFTDREHPGRRPRLVRYADAESLEYLRRFQNEYAGLDHREALAKLVDSKPKWNALRLAVALRSAAPELATDEFADILREKADGKLSDERIEELYRDHGPGTFDWNDRGYLARVHPLELWWIAYLAEAPESTWPEAKLASADVREEVYRWLFKSKRKKAQDGRIRIVLEEEAFAKVHEQWKRLGYPFDTLVPSFATAIGAAADRPNALARLVGIIQNDGVALPNVSLLHLAFAEETPYETHFERSPPSGEHVMRGAVAQRLDRELRGVVTEGTAKRLLGREPFRSDPLWDVGGKTGTGDHWRKTVDARGRVLTKTPVSRSATFVFTLGERYFGTMSAYVDGEASANYEFTSSLCVTLLAGLAPRLEPLIGTTDRPTVAMEEPKSDPKPGRAHAKPAPKSPTAPTWYRELPPDGALKHDGEWELLDYESFIRTDSL